MLMQRVTRYLFLAFKIILVYFQHTFHCLINEAAYHTCCVTLPRGAMGLSAVCYCGIS